MSNYILVYGTLKRGEINHHLIAGVTTYVGVGVVPGCLLVDMHGCPAMLPSRSSDYETDRRYHNTACGEVYDVSDSDLPDLLEQLDRLENNGRLYLRVKVRILLATRDIEGIAYIFMPEIGGKIVENGWWTRRA